MKIKLPIFLLPFVLSTLSTGILHAEQPQVSVEAAPLRYAIVEGDANKFREQNWMNDEYAGGIEDFSFEQAQLPQDLSVSMDGHAIIEDNDYEANVEVKKENFGYTKFEYQEFRKYYDNTGGVYHPFTTLRVNSLERELQMDIGHIRVETGLELEEYPHLRFAFERAFKDGAKSRLTWATVTEGGVGKNIAPSFQNIHEISDTVEIGIEHTIRGVEIVNEESWEWTDANMTREEKNLSNTATAANNKIRVQEQLPETRLFTSTTGIQKWSEDERMFGGGAYHFLHMNNSEMENIFEMNSNRVLTNFTSPKQIRDAHAENEYDSHTWVGNFMYLPWESFSINPNLRVEAMNRSGSSYYPSDTTAGAPDGIINNIENSVTEDKVAGIGESVSFRFTGIPRTALYNEFELEQVRNWLSEDRDSIGIQSTPSTGEIYGRETIDSISRGIWTIGGQFYPSQLLDITSHFRINRSNGDYDDKRESLASGAKSAFFDAMNIQTQELATHFTFKPARWIKPSFRYHYQIRNYDTRAEDQTNQRSHMDSHIFVFDTSVQPKDNVLLVTGFSPQYAWVETPARSIENANTPRFEANNFTWFSNASYDFNETVSLHGGLDYSVADNYNDNTASSLPMGSAFHQLNLSSSINWQVTKLIELELEYDFFRYTANDMVDSGDYNANLVYLKTNFSWA